MSATIEGKVNDEEMSPAVRALLDTIKMYRELAQRRQDEMEEYYARTGVTFQGIEGNVKRTGELDLRMPVDEPLGDY